MNWCQKIRLETRIRRPLYYRRIHIGFNLILNEKFSSRLHCNPVQGQNRVFPVYFSHTGINLFSLQGSQVMKTGFSLLGKVHRENPVFITGMGLQCKHDSLSLLCLLSSFLHNQEIQSYGFRR